MSSPEGRLRVSEIFLSLQGETSRVGLPTAFVRLTGCPLRCVYCDTEYAFQGGTWMTTDEIVGQVRRLGARHVTVTGGEPLAQRDCHGLLAALSDLGLDVSLETGGALDIAAVDDRVACILDIKTPGSGEADRNLWANIACLTPRDEIKFVLLDEVDYRWAHMIMAEHRLPERCPVLFSPAHGHLAPERLADWILRDGLPVRFQVQLHKSLWGEARGR